MEIRNRMADVLELRCHACQDYLKMLLDDNWQTALYNLAKHEVETNAKHKDRYIVAYEKMRDIGFENYYVDDMDVTFIATIVDARFNNLFQSMKPVNYKTRQALIRIRDDRNFESHQNGNEDKAELYLHGIMALDNLAYFVKTVDKYEASIADVLRLEFRKKYISAIDSLTSILDDERIELVQWKKQVKNDIKKIIESSDPDKTYFDTWEIYKKRYLCSEHAMDKMHYFMLCASDAGIKYAHSWAFTYYINSNDYEEADRRLVMLCSNNPTTTEVKEILLLCNELIDRRSELTNGMKKLLKEFNDKGFIIKRNESGFFVLTENIT